MRKINLINKGPNALIDQVYNNEDVYNIRMRSNLYEIISRHYKFDVKQYLRLLKRLENELVAELGGN